MSVTLTKRQKLVLAHKVEFPQEWADNAGEKAVQQKVMKYEDDYDLEAAKPDYFNRAERDAKEIADQKVIDDLPVNAVKREI
ncbi:uncharacterized protein METZ01_LOCUS367587, partial [marine metagenome]